MTDNLFIGKGSLMSSDKFLGTVKAGKFEFDPTESSFDLSKRIEWTASVEDFHRPIALTETATSLQIILPRKWWQWIIPLRTVYEGDVFVEGGEVVDDCVLEYNFTKDGPMNVRLKWAWQ